MAKLTNHSFKDIPTPKDIGLDFKISVQFHAFMARKGVPVDRQKKIQAAFKKVLTTDGFKKFLRRQPHVRVAFRDDVKKMNEGFLKGMVETRKFMARHKILNK